MTFALSEKSIELVNREASIANDCSQRAGFQLFVIWYGEWWSRRVSGVTKSNVTSLLTYDEISQTRKSRDGLAS
jgi:hypothetical protein